MDHLYKGEFPVLVLSGQPPLYFWEIFTIATGVSGWLCEDSRTVVELSVKELMVTHCEKRRKYKKLGFKLFLLVLLSSWLSILPSERIQRVCCRLSGIKERKTKMKRCISFFSVRKFLGEKEKELRNLGIPERRKNTVLGAPYQH
jgi:hypothetical protein